MSSWGTCPLLISMPAPLIRLMSFWIGSSPLQSEYNRLGEFLAWPELSSFYNNSGYNVCLLSILQSMLATTFGFMLFTLHEYFCCKKYIDWLQRWCFLIFLSNPVLNVCK